MSNFFSKTILIFSREYNTRVRNKWFLITTFLVPLGIIAVMAISGFASYQAAQSGDQRNVIIFDEADVVSQQYPRIDSYTFEQENSALIEGDIQSLIYDQEFDIVIDIPVEALDLNNVELTVYSRPGISLQNELIIQSFLRGEILNYKIQEAEFSAEQIQVLQTQVSLQRQSITQDGESQQDTGFVSYALGYGSGIIIYFSLFLYGTMVMRGVIEEKSNRVVEIIVSSVKPIHLMMGKILGIAAVSLTQLLIWIVTVSIIGLIYFQIPFFNELSPFSLDQALDAFMEANVLGFLVYLPLYYLGGYLLYSSLFAAVGSTVENEKDSQALVLPITIPIILSFVLMFSVLENPDSILAIGLSIFPFTSPIIMMARLPFSVPLWQLLISIVLLYTSFYLLTLLAARIYRIGILMYGKKPSPKEILKWMGVRV